MLECGRRQARIIRRRVYSGQWAVPGAYRDTAQVRQWSPYTRVCRHTHAQPHTDRHTAAQGRRDRSCLSDLRVGASEETGWDAGGDSKSSD